MAATFQWCEDNGAATGSPNHGTTRSGFGADTHYPIETNWKNVDDNAQNGGTAYSSAPITAGNNSYEKFQYGHFSGSYSNISAGLWTAHDDASSFGTGLTLKGTVSSTYTTPATATNAALTTNFTSQVAVASGLAVLYSATGPEAAGPVSSSASNPLYTQYLISQLQTTGGASAGDTNQVTLKLQYTEN